MEGEGGGGQRLSVSEEGSLSASLRASERTMVVLAIFSKMPPCISFRSVIYLTDLNLNKKSRFCFTISVFYTTVIIS